MCVHVHACVWREGEREPKTEGKMGTDVTFAAIFLTAERIREKSLTIATRDKKITTPQWLSPGSIPRDTGHRLEVFLVLTTQGHATGV